MPDVQILLYASYMRAAIDGGTIWDASTDLTLTLHTSTYVPDRSTHAFVSDLTDELSTGNGYTQGGVTLVNPATATLDADSWSVAWQSNTEYDVAKVIRPQTVNSFVYMVSVSGTSGSTEPSFPTVIGASVVDGTVTWVAVGQAAIFIDADDLLPAWSSFSAGPFRHVVLSDRAPSTAATQPLIGVYTFGSDQTGSGGAFDIVFDDAGVIAIPVP